MTDSDDKALGLPTKQQHRSLDSLRSALQTWLQKNHPAGEALTISHINLPSGSGLANETVLLDVQWQHHNSQHSARYVVRIETAEPLFPGITVETQYLMNKALAKVGTVPIPAVIGLETDTRVLGAAFYLMERIDGQVPADDPPFNHNGWVVDLSEPQRARLFDNAVRTMANLHAVDARNFGFLNPDNATDGLRQNLDYYIRSFDLAANEPHRVVDAARQWLLDNYPTNNRSANNTSDNHLALAWGDARVGNMIFEGEQCQAVLDWDMVSLAGAETDLAWWACLDQAFSTSAGIPRLAGLGNPAQMIALWQQCTGRKVQNFDWHLAFAFYKSAVIVRRLAAILKQQQLLPLSSEFMAYNNLGMQYLASFLDLPSDHPIDTPWPGLDV